MAARKALIDKINALPFSRLSEVEDFVDFLLQKERDRALSRAAATASTPVYTEGGEDPEEDGFDAFNFG